MTCEPDPVIPASAAETLVAASQAAERYPLTAKDRVHILRETADVRSQYSQVMAYRPASALSVGDLVRHVAEFVRHEPLARFRLSPDRTYWTVADSLDLEEVVFVHDLEGGNWPELLTLAGISQQAPLDLESGAAWRLNIVTGTDLDGMGPGGFVLSWTFHHALLDGMACIRFLEAFHRPGSAPLIASDFRPRNPLASGLAAWSTAQRWPLTEPLALHDLGLRMPVARTRFNGPVDASRTQGVVWADLDTFRTIGTATGAKFNDVLAVVASRSIQRFLESVGEPVSGPLAAMVPVDAHIQPDDPPYGNCTTAFALPLPDAGLDPRDALMAVRNDSQRRKRAIEKLGRTTLADLLELAPLPPGNELAEWLHRLRLSRVLPPVCSVVVSSTPAPAGDWRVCDAPLSHWTSVATIDDGCSLVHGAITCNDRVALTLSSTPLHVPDIGAYQTIVRDTLAELAEAARNAA